MNLWCCQCQSQVDARLTTGAEVYPNRPDLADIPRWICNDCRCHVGTHHKTADPHRPLGNIPSPALRRARTHIHALIDPVWKSGRISRGQLYSHISQAIGHEYHTAELRTIEEARIVYRVARDFIATIN